MKTASCAQKKGHGCKNWRGQGFGQPTATGATSRSLSHPVSDSLLLFYPSSRRLFASELLIASPHSRTHEGGFQVHMLHPRPCRPSCATCDPRQSAQLQASFSVEACHEPRLQKGDALLRTLACPKHIYLDVDAELTHRGNKCTYLFNRLRFRGTVEAADSTNTINCNYIGRC